MATINSIHQNNYSLTVQEVDSALQPYVHDRYFARNRLDQNGHCLFILLSDEGSRPLSSDKNTEESMRWEYLLFSCAPIQSIFDEKSKCMAERI